MARLRSVHLSHAVDSDHANLVVQVVLVYVALVEDYLEKKSELVHIDTL